MMTEDMARTHIEKQQGVYLGSFPKVVPDDCADAYNALKPPRGYLRCELVTESARFVYAIKQTPLLPGERPGMITPTLYYRLENHQRWDFQPGESWTAEDEEKFQAENIVTGSFRGGVHPNLRDALDRLSPRKSA